MVDTILLIAAVIIMLAIFISAFRIVIGPDIVDRVISFDVITVSSIALISIVSSLLGRIIYLYIAIVYGVLSFLSVIIIGLYIEKGL